MIILLFGVPGTGKSTYASYIAEKLGLEKVSTGDILRTLSTKDERMAEFLKAGQLISDEEVDRIVYERLGKTDGKFVLDGYPRTMNQAHNLLRFLGGQGWRVDQVFYLKVPVEVLTARMLARGRTDDTAEVVTERFRIFEQETHPVLRFFAERGYEMHEIENSRPIEEVKRSFDEFLTVKNP